MSQALHNGGCQCGDVRFEASGDPKFACNCHCESCRKASGAAFSTWIGFNNEKFRWTTKPPSYYASSPGVKRGFCANCGTPLTYEGEKWTGETHFLIGVFDKPEAYKPKKNVFTEDALTWAFKESAE